jgi:hypothetical protein
MPPNCAPIYNSTYYMCTNDGLYCFWMDKAMSKTYEASSSDCESRGGVLVWYKSYGEQLEVEVGRCWPR